MTSRLADFYLRIDLRSLGVFRILLGALLLGDCFERWPNIEAFYTSGGVFAGIDRPTGPLTLLESFRTLTQAQGFFIFSAICYCLLLIGYRTRLFHVLSFVCFMSIVNRTLLVRAGDDLVLASMLMWTIFLPMGGRFSLDALQGRSAASSDNLSGRSLAGFCAVAQIGIIYFCTAFAKSGVTWWDGTAIYYALQLDQFTRELGHFVAGLPMYVIKPMTWATLAVEVLALPMMLSPFFQPYLRRSIIIALCLLHLGIALTMTLDFFAAKMIATFALLLRPEDWRLIGPAGVWIRESLGRRVPRGVVGVWGDVQGGWRAIFALPARIAVVDQVAPASPARVIIDRLVFGVGQLGIALIFAAILIENYNANLRPRLQSAAVPPLPVFHTFIVRTQLAQNWSLFAPNPSRENGWWVIDGITQNGKRLDPLTGQTPTFEKPANLSSRHDRYWQKYLARLWLKTNAHLRPGFARYVTRTNHRASPPGEQLKEFTLNYVPRRTESLGAPAQPAAKPERVLSWDCFARPVLPPKSPTAVAPAAARAPSS